MRGPALRVGERALSLLRRAQRGRKAALATPLAVASIAALATVAPVAVVATMASRPTPAFAAGHKHGSHGEGPRRPRPALPATASTPALPSPALLGQTVDYAWDGREGRDPRQPEKAWLGRAWIPEALARTPERPAPLLIFLHGLNHALIPYRWMGGGSEGDVRRLVSRLIDEGRIPPVLVAAPSSVVPSMKTARASWVQFDVDHFLEQTEAALRGKARIDREHVVLVGHSGAGCDPRGGLALAKEARTPFEALLSIDTCMGLDLAKALGSMRPETRVLVTYQDQSWSSRPFARFRRVFEEASAQSGAPSEARRLERLEPRGPGAHDALVWLTLRSELPRLWGGLPREASDSAAPSAPSAN